MRIFFVIAILLGAVVAACATDYNSAQHNVIRYKEMLARNQEAISRLALGMSKDDVITIMGTYSAQTKNGFLLNPMKAESFTVGADVYETLLYATSPHSWFAAVNDSQATPVVLKNGKVVGWGKAAADAIGGKLGGSTSP